MSVLAPIAPQSTSTTIREFDCEPRAAGTGMPERGRKCSHETRLCSEGSDD